MISKMPGNSKRKESSLSDEHTEENINSSSAVEEKENAFKPINEIEFKFLLRDAETITEGLSKFVRTSEAHSDGLPCPDVVAKYLKSSPGCAELLALLEPTETSLKSAGVALVFKCLEQILIRIRTDLTKSLSAGEVIVQKILAAHMRQVYSCLQAQSKSNIIKSALQLLIAMVMLSEKSKKAVQMRLNFAHIHFAALFKRRNRKDPQDVRSCMVLLTLAFLLNSDNNTVTSLVQQKTFLHLTIAGLKFDAKEVVVDVLLTLLDKVVKNTGVSKTDKVKLFSEVVLRQLAELHHWQGPQAWSPTAGSKQKQDEDPGPSIASSNAEDLAQVADVADGLLVELCCSQVSFRDKTVGTGTRNQNQLLSHFVTSLSKHMEEPRKAALMVKVLAASPDLVRGVLTELQASLAPRWSDSWSHLVEWVATLYRALPDVPPILTEIEKSIGDEQKTVAIATVYCLPPSKVALTLAQSLKHEDMRVRHSYLELVQVLARKAYDIQNALVSRATEQGLLRENVESLKDLFMATVLKALPPTNQLFICVDKVSALTDIGSLAGKDAMDVIEQRLGVAPSDHLCRLLQVLSLYQTLSPSLLAQRPKDISRLIQVVGNHMTTVDDSSPDKVQGVEVAAGDCEDKTGDGGAASGPDRVDSNLLPQLYLLKLLSETDARSLSLGREGVLEKLLLSARSNTRYMDLTVSLICKMLQSMEVFSGHGDELAVWLRNALDSNSYSSDGDNEERNTSTNKLLPSSQKKQASKGKELEEQTLSKTNKGLAREPSQEGIVTFLANCLSTLVNNPTPFADRVMEALTVSDGDDEDENNIEDSMDVSSIGTNESAREAILLMDDETLDKLVASTAVNTGVSDPSDGDDSTTVKTNSDNVDLQVSPLVLVALDQLKHNDKVEAGAQDYVSKVLLDLVHSLPSPVSLVRVVERSGLSNQLCPGLGHYLQSLGTSHPDSTATVLEPALCGPFTSILLTLHRHDDDSPDLGSPKKFQKLWKQICREVKAMAAPQRLTALSQVMLYLTEALSSSYKIPSLDKMAHMYRLTAESLLDLVLDQQGEFGASKNVLSGDKHGETDSKSDQKDETEEGVLEILSNLRSEESSAHKAVKRVLLCPAILKTLRTCATSSPSKKKPVVSRDGATIAHQVLLLVRNVLRKCTQFSWFKNEAEFAQCHANIAICLFLKDFKERQRDSSSGKQKEGKKKTKNKTNSEVEHDQESISQCSREIVHLLFEHLDLVSLSQCIAMLFKFKSLHSAMTEGDSEASESASAVESCSGTRSPNLGELLIQMMQHWTEKMAAELAPEGLEVLIDSYSEHQGKAKMDKNMTNEPCADQISSKGKRPNQDFELGEKKTGLGDNGSFGSDKCLELKVVPSFEELCKLTTADFKPFFKLALSSDSLPLRDCALRVLVRVPQLVAVCGECLVELALSSSDKMEARVESEEVLQRVNSWLLGHSRERLIHTMGCLRRAVLEAKETNAELTQDKVTSMQHIFPTGKDGLHDEIKLLCMFLGSTRAYTTLSAALASDNPGQPGHLSIIHYEILLAHDNPHHTATVPHPGVVHNKQKPQTDQSSLELILRHLDQLAAGKRKNEALEDYLLSAALKQVSGQSGKHLKFLPNLWGSLVKNTLRHLYKNPKLLELLAALAPHVYCEGEPGQDTVTKATAGATKKPLQFPSSKTLFQMCASHTAFFAVMMSDEFPEAKAGLVKLLFTLGETDSSCYEKQLTKVLVAAYGGTLSYTDQCLLQMIERTSRDSEGAFDCPLLWGKSVVDQHSVSQALGSTLHRETPVADVLAQLDAGLLRRSMVSFPLRRTLVGIEVADAEKFKSKGDCYDPRFLLRVLANVLTPDKRVPMYQFVEKGCLGYLLTALSSHAQGCRLLAYQALNDFYTHAQGSRWGERSEVCFLLDLLNASRSQSGQKLSFVVALFFAQVARLFLYPADPLYMPICRFLVVRPEMDLRNVPEFFKLFFSSSSNYRIERNWVLSLLAEGLRESSDYWLYQKKSIFKIVLSFYGSSISDKHSQSLVLSIVKAACLEKSVAVHLVKNNGLLVWLAAAVAGLQNRPEHTDQLCDIVHCLWSSLVSQEHVEEASSETKGKKDAGEGDDNEDKGEDDDGDDEDGSSDNSSSDEPGSAVDDGNMSRKRKKVSTPERVKKRKTSSGSVQISSKVGGSVLDNDGDDSDDEKNEMDTDDDDDDDDNDDDDNERGSAGDASVNKTTADRAGGLKARGKKGRPSAPPSVPKSTVVELGLIVGSLVWHLRSATLTNVGKVLEVLHWLVLSGSSLPISQQQITLTGSGQASAADTSATSPAELDLSQSSLVSLPAAQACILLHRLGTAAEWASLVSAVERGLTSMGLNVREMVGPRATVVERGAKRKMKEAPEASVGGETGRAAGDDDRDDAKAEEEKDMAVDGLAKEEVQASICIQSLEEVVERERHSSGRNSAESVKEQVKRMLEIFSDINTRTQTVKFL